MVNKNLIRKKYFLKRKKNYYQVKKNFFNPIVKIIKKANKNRKIYISLYYPNSFEVDVFKIFENEYCKKLNYLLPVIENNGTMNFFKWEKNDLFNLNKYGIPEPRKTKKISPDIIFLPLLAFDEKKNRLGYGKGFYDKFLHKLKKLNKKIITVGVAFSFQKYKNLPVNNKDFKLDYIITEKGLK